MEEWSSTENLTLANDSFATVPHHHRLLFHNYPDSLLNFAVAACIIFILVGIPGNLITIIALVRYGKVRSATAIFIINLSVSDLMFCCFNLPLATSLFHHRDWVHGDVLCQLFPLLRYGLLAVSIFTILAITLNRYVMIGHPRWYPKLYKRRHLWIMIALTWAGCFGSLIPTLLGKWGRFGLDYSIGSCSILPDETTHKSPKEFLFVVAFVLPCLAIVVCYARIFFIVRKAAAASRSKGPTASGHAGLHADASGGAGGKDNGASHQRAKSKTTRLCPPTQGTKEASSFNLTCCESQQASGSTDTSDESQPPITPCHQRRPSTEHILHNKKSAITLVQAPAKSSTILRWQGTKKSPVRIEVDHGTVVDEDMDQTSDEVQEQSSARSGAWDSSRLSIPDIRIETASITSATGGNGRSQRSLSFDLGGGNGGSSCPGQNFLLSASSGRQSPPSRSVSPTPTELSSPVSSHSMDSHNYSRRGKECSSNAPQHVNVALAHVTNVLTRRSTRVKRALHVGRMTPKDRKLLQMILVIFISFVVCYMPITIVKLLSKETDLRVLNILSYVLIYLTTSINPVIYVAMSSEYRQAYKNLLTCKMSTHTNEPAGMGNNRPGISRSMSQKA